MNQLQRLQRRVENFYIARRNHSHPFEFGPVEPRDRFRLAAELRRMASEPNGQSFGQPIDARKFSFPIELLAEGRPPGAAAAAASFRVIQSMFESLRVERKLAPWTVLGFMTDEVEANGIAMQLHDDDATRFAIVVTTGSFFESCLSAFHIASFKGFCPELPNTGHVAARCEALHPGKTIEIPLSVERRQLAYRVATKALKATFFHELAHVLRGHLGYWKKTTGSNPESSSKHAHSSDSGHSADSLSEIRLAIETDADDFAGRFMAHVIRKKFGGRSVNLDDRHVRNEVFETVVGVTLMYALFPGSELYHDGTLRALVLLSSMCVELGMRDGATVKWLSERVEGVAALMRQRGLLRRNLGAIEASELSVLINATLERRARLQHYWLAYRPDTWRT